MKVLLFRPPASFFSGAIAPSISLPLGLLSIAAMLDKEGFTVSVYDAQVNTDHPVSDDGGGMLMGDPWEKVAEKIAAADADIVGISCGFSTQLENALVSAKLIRKVKPEAITIMGGAHATVRPSDFLGENSSVDLVCIGEGEYTMLDLVRAADSKGDINGIQGTAVWSDGMTMINAPRSRIKNLDGLPLPAYHLVNLEDYFQLFEKGYADRPGILNEDSHRAVSVVTSRGCPFNCVFCSIHLHMGKQWRGNSESYVTEHIELLVHNYGVRHIHFEDDNISFNRARFEGIVASLTNFDITWDTPNGVRVDTLTEPIVNQCRKSGCTYLVLGVESGCQRVLDKVIDKQLDLSTVVDAASWCKRAKLDAMAFFVIGFPGETKHEMRETIDFAMMLLREYDVNPHLFVATPLPGTVLEKIFLEENLINEPLESKSLAAMTQGNFVVGAEGFNEDEIALLLKEFFRRYKKVFICNSLKFLLSHPFVSVEIMKLISRKKGKMTLKEKTISTLFVKKHYLKS